MSDQPKPPRSYSPTIREPPARPPRKSPNLGRIHIWRGYRVTKLKGEQMRASHLFHRFFPDLPKAFVWTRPQGLHEYIDALYRKDTQYCELCEMQGRVIDLVFPGPHETGPTENYQVNFRHFIEAMKLRGHFNMPLWGRIRFVTDGHYLAPVDFISALVSAAPEEFPYDPKAGWSEATSRRLREAGIEQQDITTAFNVRASAAARGDPIIEDPQGAPLEAHSPVEGPVAPPRERTLSRRDLGTHIDWLTETQPDEGQGERWYTRRVYLPETGDMLYVATSWAPRGPWRVWERDASRLLALGLDL